MSDTPAAPSLRLTYSSVEGPAAKVLKLDGSLGVTHTFDGTAGNAFPTGGLTLSCWLRGTQSDVNAVLFGYGGVTGDSSHRLWLTDPGNLTVHYGTSSSPATGLSWNDGHWHHLTVVVAPSDRTHYQVQIYKDGVLRWQSQGALRFPAGKELRSDGEMVLGKGVAGGSETGYVGEAAELQLWSGVRGAAEIVTLLQRRAVDGQSGLILHWPLDVAPSGNTIPPADLVASTLRFRQPDPGRPDFVTAAWPAVTGATGYDLQVVSDDGAFTFEKTGILPNDVPVAVPGVLMNGRLKARARAHDAGGPGPWSAVAELVPIDLPPVELSLSWPAGGDLSAQWPAVDQAQRFQVGLYKGAATTPETTTEQTDRAYPLASKKDDADAWRIVSRAISVVAPLTYGSMGPGNTPGNTEQTPLSFDYVAPENGGNGSFEFDWATPTPAPDYFYLVVQKAGNPPRTIASEHVAGSTQPPVTIPAPAPVTAGEQFIGQLRWIGRGVISAWDSKTITARNLVGPDSLTVTDNFGLRQVTAGWHFDTSGLTGVSYVAELRQDTTVLDTKTPTDTSAVLSYPGTVSRGTTLEVRVRAVAGGSHGLWSQRKLFTVGSNLGQVVLKDPTSDSDGNLTVSWSPVPDSGVTYDLEMTGPSSFSYTQNGIASTTVQLPRTTTHVVVGGTYSIVARASAAGVHGPWSDTKSVKAGQETPPDHGGGGGSSHGGDPFNLATGWYSYLHTDITVEGVVPLRFTTYYNTFTSLPSDDPPAPDKPLGGRWNHFYNTRITKSADGKQAALWWGNGVISLYDVPASVTGLYTKKGLPDGNVLQVDAQLSYLLTLRDQTVYRFSPNGALTQIVSPQGNPVNLTYTGGALTRITDQGSGRYLDLCYTTSGADAGRIQNVTDNTGRRISYAYQSDNLVTMTAVQGYTRTFTYHDKSMMKTATDENGHVFITNTYDPEGRIQTQKDARATANGESYQISLAYADITYQGVECVQTTLTDRMGYTSVYISNKVTRNTLSEVHNLAGGGVRRVLRDFDGSGNLLHETVMMGPTSTADTVGNKTSYTYDGNRNVLTITDPVGNVRTFTYDDRNNLLTATDLLGNVTSMTYQAGTNLLQTVIDPYGNKQVIVYKAVRNPSSQDILGLPETVTDYPAGDGGVSLAPLRGDGSLGNVTTFHYDDNGALGSRTGPLGTVTLYGYDTGNHGWLTSITDNDKAGTLVRQTTIVPWPQTGWVKQRKILFPNQPANKAFTTTYGYDKLGLCTSVSNPVNETTGYRFDPNNLLDQITYPVVSGSPDTTVYAYNRNDELDQITYSPSAPTVIEKKTYTHLGWPLTLTDADGQVTTMGYAMDLGTQPCPWTRTVTLPPVQVPKAGGGTEAVTYEEQQTFDPLGRIIELTDRTPQGTAGAATKITYTVITDPTTHLRQLKVTVQFPPAEPGETPFTTETVHDGLGRPVSHTDQGGRKWSWRYTTEVDATTQTTRRVATLTDPLGNQRVEVTDPLGRTVARKVGKGTAWRTASYAYDAIGRLGSVTEPDPAHAGSTVTTVYTYGYDSTANGLLVTVAPHGLPASTYLYDGAGQWLRYTDAHGDTVQMTYSPRGQLLTCRNGRLQTLTYGYDKAGRFTTITLPAAGGTIVQVLDGNGNRLQTQVDGTVAVNRVFDALNRMTSRTDTASGDTVAYSYTPMDRLETLTYPGLATPVTYDYDGLQRMKTVTDWRSRITRYTWYPTGQMKTETLPAGVDVGYSFDDADRFTGLEAKVGNDVIASESLVLDAFGEPATGSAVLPLAPARTAAARRFTYEDADRLKTVDGQDVLYDDDGNMTTIPGISGALAYNVFNQLTQVGASQLTYDVDGLPRTATRGGATTRYVQDVADYVAPRLNQADPARAVAATELFPFPSGPEGSLPIDKRTGEVERPGRALSRLLATVEGTTVTARYVYGMGLIGREDAGGTFQSYVFDGRGSTLALVDGSGQVTDRYAYTPYGQPAGQEGSTDNPFRFHGRHGVLTDASGLCWMRDRSYAPGLLRFVERDFLFGNLYRPQSLNRYAFVTGNPIQWIDPLGLSGGGDDDRGGGGGLFAAIVGGVLLGTLLGGSLLAGGTGAIGGVFGAAGAGAAGAAAAEGTGVTASLLRSTSTDSIEMVERPRISRPGLRRRIVQNLQPEEWPL